jgi:mannan endo-1,4-beta-mannosidase
MRGIRLAPSLSAACNADFSTNNKFYRLPQIKAAFKRYIKALITRHKNSPTILAWELANEARCGADGVRNLPRSPAGCSPELITAWYDEMSAYIKSLDPHHLVTTGSEGGFNVESEDWAYNGADGSDFDAELGLKNIDFGTFHSYPDWWSKTVEWTVQWIEDHGAAMRGGRKPVVHEEYGELWRHLQSLLPFRKQMLTSATIGWLTPSARLEYLNRTETATRVEVLSLWQKTSLKERISDMYWQFGFSGYSYGRNHDDGFTIYLDE